MIQGELVECDECGIGGTGEDIGVCGEELGVPGVSYVCQDIICPDCRSGSSRLGGDVER